MIVKNFFKQKSAIVHFLDMTEITDRTTEEIINYIAYEIIYPITQRDLIYAVSGYFYIETIFTILGITCK